MEHDACRREIQSLAMNKIGLILPQRTKRLEALVELRSSSPSDICHLNSSSIVTTRWTRPLYMFVFSP